jgi:hypothetical protein
MPVRRLPVRPDSEQLHRQAKELLRAIHAGEATAIAELREASSRIDRSLRREAGRRATRARAQLPGFELDAARSRGAAGRRDLAR